MCKISSKIHLHNLRTRCCSTSSPIFFFMDLKKSQRSDVTAISSSHSFPIKILSTPSEGVIDELLFFSNVSWTCRHKNRISPKSQSRYSFTPIHGILQESTPYPCTRSRIEDTEREIFLLHWNFLVTWMNTFLFFNILFVTSIMECTSKFEWKLIFFSVSMQTFSFPWTAWFLSPGEAILRLDDDSVEVVISPSFLRAIGDGLRRYPGTCWSAVINEQQQQQRGKMTMRMRGSRRYEDMQMRNIYEMNTRYLWATPRYCAVLILFSVDLVRRLISSESGRRGCGFFADSHVLTFWLIGGS